MITFLKRQAGSRFTRALWGWMEQMISYIDWVGASEFKAAAAAQDVEVSVCPEGSNHGVSIVDVSSTPCAHPGGGPPQHWLDRVARGAPALLRSKPVTNTQAGEFRRDRDASGAIRSAPQTIVNEGSVPRSAQQSDGQPWLASSPTETEIKLIDGLASQASARTDSGVPYRFWQSAAHRLPSGDNSEPKVNNERGVQTVQATASYPRPAASLRFSTPPNSNAPVQARRIGLPSRESALSDEHGSRSTAAVSTSASSSDPNPLIKSTTTGPGLRLQSSRDDNRCSSKLLVSNECESQGVPRSSGNHDPMRPYRKDVTANAKAFQCDVIRNRHSSVSETTKDPYDRDHSPSPWPELEGEQENDASRCSRSDDRWPDLPQTPKLVASETLEQNTLQGVSVSPRRSHQARLDREQQGLIWNG